MWREEGRVYEEGIKVEVNKRVWDNSIGGGGEGYKSVL
jgi:hypothetical protein